MYIKKLTCIFFNAFILLFTGFGKLEINEKVQDTRLTFYKEIINMAVIIPLP